MKTLKRHLLVIVSVFIISLFMITAQAASNLLVSDAKADAKPLWYNTSEEVVGKPPKEGVSGILKNVVNVLLFLSGALSVIFIIYGGVRYTTSGGNPENIKAAKSTLIYAIVGLIVSILAFAIVNFVLTRLK